MNVASTCFNNTPRAGLGRHTLYLLPANEVAVRLCFYTCLSVHKGVCMAGQREGRVCMTGGGCVAGEACMVG